MYITYAYAYDYMIISISLDVLHKMFMSFSTSELVVKSALYTTNGQKDNRGLLLTGAPEEMDK